MCAAGRGPSGCHPGTSIGTCWGPPKTGIKLRGGVRPLLRARRGSEFPCVPPGPPTGPTHWRWLQRGGESQAFVCIFGANFWGARRPEKERARACAVIRIRIPHLHTSSPAPPLPSPGPALPPHAFILPFFPEEHSATVCPTMPLMLRAL